jgi:hypothetical protein
MTLLVSMVILFLIFTIVLQYVHNRDCERTIKSLNANCGWLYKDRDYYKGLYQKIAKIVTEEK